MAIRLFCEVDPVPWAEDLVVDKQPEVLQKTRLGVTISCGFCRCFYLGREVILQQELGLIQRCLCLVVWWFVFFMVGFV